MVRPPFRFFLFSLMAITAAARSGDAAAAIERISVATGGGEANSQSRYPAISGDGRYVVFLSDASNLVAGDTNAAADVFLRDRLLGTTTRISTAAGGAQADAQSYEPSISGDGSRIVFASHAALLPGAGWNECYLLDRRNGTLAFVNVRPNGEPSGNCDEPTIDVAGTHVAFTTPDGLQANDTAGSLDVYVRDFVAGTIRRVSGALGGGEGNGGSTDGRISGDGSRVLFASNSTNLVAGDSNGQNDIFLAASDASLPLTRVNVGPSGTQADGWTSYSAALNANGTLLAFSSNAPALPDPDQFADSTLYLRIPSSDDTYALSIPNDGLPREATNDEPDFDYSGRWLVFASGDVMFDGSEPGIYVIDLVRGLIALVSVGGHSGNVYRPRISADGRGVVWYSLSDTQVPGDTNGTWDVFYGDNPLWDDTLFANGFEG